MPDTDIAPIAPLNTDHGHYTTHKTAKTAFRSLIQSSPAALRALDGLHLTGTLVIPSPPESR